MKFVQLWHYYLWQNYYATTGSCNEGRDKVSKDMIKAISPYAREAVMYHVDESQLKGEFPKPWKMSIVHPLPKTQSNVFNLRSYICHTSKVYDSGNFGHSPDSYNTLNSRTSFQSYSHVSGGTTAPALLYWTHVWGLVWGERSGQV